MQHSPACSSYSHDKQWTMVTRRRERWTGEQRRRHGLDAGMRSRHHRSNRATDRRVPRGFTFFQIIKNRLKFVKSKYVSYVGSKIPSFLHETRLDFYEQVYQLC
jgi:hypothetical protein